MKEDTKLNLLLAGFGSILLASMILQESPSDVQTRFDGYTRSKIVEDKFSLTQCKVRAEKAGEKFDEKLIWLRENNPRADLPPMRSGRGARTAEPTNRRRAQRAFADSHVRKTLGLEHR